MGWWGPGGGPRLEDVVDASHAVAAALAVELVVAADRDHAPWHPGRCARIELTDGTLVGHAGELHPKVLRSAGAARAHLRAGARRRRAHRRQ